jgi:hypothetical protein
MKSLDQRLASRKILLHQILLTLAAFLLSQMVLAVVIQVWGGSYFHVANWIRWDSGHYVHIAKQGYELFPCAGKLGFPEDSKDMCGNTGWFPGYPFAVKFFTFFFRDAALVAGVLSKLCLALSLWMVLKITKTDRFSARNLLFLLIPTFGFSFIYYSAAFPISMVVLFALCGLYFFLHKAMFWTGFFCLLAAFTYPTGFLLAVAFATVILVQPAPFKKRVRDIGVVAGLGALGVIGAFLIFQLTVGDWKAFIEVQGKYGHSIQSPLKNMGSFFEAASLTKPFAIENFIQYQAATVIAGYLLLSFFFFYKRLYKTELYLWTFVYVTLFFLFPWAVGGDLSRYRAEALLFPFALFMKDAKTPWLALLLVGLLGLGIPMSYLFFNYTLI